MNENIIIKSALLPDMPDIEKVRQQITSAQTKKNSSAAKTIISVAACSVIIVGAALAVTRLGNSPKHKVFFDSATPLSMGYVCCYSNGSDIKDSNEASNVFGIASANKEVIITPQYDYVDVAGENRFIVSNETEENDIQTALINEKNEIIIPFSKCNINSSSDNCVLIVEKDGKFSLTDMDGNTINNCVYDSMEFAPESNKVYAYDGKSCTFLDYDGNTITTITSEPQQYEALPGGQFFKTIGYFPNLTDGTKLRYGVVDNSGKTLIECKYNEVKVIGNNRLYARKGPSDCFEPTDDAILVDESGKVLVAPGQYTSLWFGNDDSEQVGIATKHDSSTTGTKWLITLDGNLLSDGYDSITRNQDGTFTAEKDGAKTVLSIDGDGYICNHSPYYHTLSGSAIDYVNGIEPGAADRFIEMFGRTEDCNQRAFMDYFGLGKSDYWVINSKNYVDSLDDAEYAKTFNPDAWFADDYATNSYFLKNDDPAPDEGSVFIRPEGDAVHTDRYFTINVSLIEYVGEENFNEFKEKYAGTQDFNILKFIKYFGIEKEEFARCVALPNEPYSPMYIYNPEYVYSTEEMQKQYFEKHLLG